MIDLIYTSGNNRRYASMTLDAHWQIGIRSDKHAYVDFPIRFVDVDYKAPNFARHLEMVKIVRPKYATVPDLSDKYTSKEDVMRALRQADKLQPYCDVVLIVPKLKEQLALLPGDVAIGYSIDTGYGGAGFCFLETVVQEGLANRHIHLLGGSPQEQMRHYLQLSCFCQVVSADGNMMQFMSGFQKYWKRGDWRLHPSAGQGHTQVTHQCIEWSLANIRRAWQLIVPLSEVAS